MTLAELRALRAKKLDEMRSMSDRAESESRDFTADEDAAWKKSEDDVAQLERRISRQEQADKFRDECKPVFVPETEQSRKIEVGKTLLDDDPKRGYKSHSDFLLDVMEVRQGRRREGDSLRSLRAVGSDEQSGFSDTYGGYLLPTAFIPNVLRITPEADPVSGLTTRIPMAAQTVEMDYRVDKNHSTSVAGGLVVTRREEAGSIDSSRMKFEKLTMKASMLMGLAYATEELLTMSPVSFTSLLATGFNDAFASKILDERLRGTGVGEFLGVLNSPALVTVAKESQQTADTINFTNVIKMRSRCWGYSSAIWLYNPDCLPQLAQLVLPTGSGITPMWVSSARDGEPDMLFGRPAIACDACATVGDLGDIVLANWSEYLEGTFQPLQSAESIHVRFVEHERAFKFWLMNCGAPWWSSPLTPKKGANTRSPFVTLEAR